MGRWQEARHTGCKEMGRQEERGQRKVVGQQEEKGQQKVVGQQEGVGQSEEGSWNGSLLLRLDVGLCLPFRHPTSLSQYCRYPGSHNC